MESKIYITKGWSDYELLDSGDFQKLERFGEVVLSRPDPQAMWKKHLPESEWQKADGIFEQHGVKSKWTYNLSAEEVEKELPKVWQVIFSGLTFLLKTSMSKHTGIFPEQSVGWQWLREKIKERIENGKEVSVLNLFGYTGGMSLSALSAGASVSHVDASPIAVEMAEANCKASGLSEKPIRFFVDDVRKFVEKEIRRGKKYDVICMDPPVYGKGTKKEQWNLETDLPELLPKIKKLLSDEPLAIILNGYSSGYSHITYGQLLKESIGDIKAELVTGELAIAESGTGRLLPAGIFARLEF